MAQEFTREARKRHKFGTRPSRPRLNHDTAALRQELFAAPAEKIGNYTHWAALPYRELASNIALHQVPDFQERPLQLQGHHKAFGWPDIQAKQPRIAPYTSPKCCCCCCGALRSSFLNLSLDVGNPLRIFRYIWPCTRTFGS